MMCTAGVDESDVGPTCCYAQAIALLLFSSASHSPQVYIVWGVARYLWYPTRNQPIAVDRESPCTSIKHLSIRCSHINFGRFECLQYFAQCSSGHRGVGLKMKTKIKGLLCMLLRSTCVYIQH